MYNVPNDFPFSSIEMAEIIQLCFGQNELIINLSNDVSILVMCSLEIKAEKVEYIEDYSKSSREITEFLGKSIKSCKATDQGNLHLNFGNKTITLICDSDIYECYVVTVGNKIYVV